MTVKHPKQEQIETYLRPTPTIDSDSEAVLEFVGANSPDGATARDRAVALYYAVRDQVRYDPYTISSDPGDYSASQTLTAGRGWCVKKAILYAACCRGVGIPARLGYANVRNHLSTENLSRLMGTDVFYWHGYTDVYLGRQWVKATPVFNRELCAKFRLKPLEFDGLEDSIFHPYDLEGKQHMEYLKYHGVFADLPFERMMKDLIRHYPRLMDVTRRGDSVWRA